MAKTPHRIRLLRQLVLALMLYSAAAAKEHLRVRRLAAESVTAAPLPNASKIIATEQIEGQTELPGSAKATPVTEINQIESESATVVPANQAETRNSAYDLAASSSGSDEDGIYYDNAPVDCDPELVGFEIVTG